MKKFLLAGALVALLGAPVSNARAEESQAAICSNRVRQFVADLDDLLTKSPRSVMTVIGMMRKHLPVKGCDVADVIATSKTSKFFHGAYEWDLSYTIAFQSSDFIVSFGLRKATGDIEVPFARVRGYLLYD